MVTTVSEIEAPAVTLPRSTLLDVAEVTDDFAWRQGDALWQTYNCLRFDGNANFCTPNAKDLSDVAGWVDGFRFAAYGGVTCSMVGNDPEEQEEGVRRAFEAGESTAVEKAMMATRFVENDGSVIPGEWDAPTDVNAAGAVKATVGVGLLEEAAGDLYVGTPTLHIPRSVAALLLALNGAEFEGDVLRTQLGSKIAVGAGYGPANTSPTGTAAAAGTRWIYATGEVFIGRGDAKVYTAPDIESNEWVTLAERPYIAAVDCFAVAVRVNLEG